MTKFSLSLPKRGHREEGITSIDRNHAAGFKRSFHSKNTKTTTTKPREEKKKQSVVCVLFGQEKEKGWAPFFKRPKKKKRHKFVHDLGTAPLSDIQHNKIEIIIMKILLK